MAGPLSRVPRPLDFDAAAFRRLAPFDLLAILAFVGIGEVSHGARSLGVLPLLVITTATFALGWLAVAPLLGAYGTRTADAWLDGTVAALPSWPLAAGVAQALRSTTHIPGNAALSFYVISVIFGALLLAGARFVGTRNR
ncbi:MAG: DUF3054 domain-containing protein [Halanaeroarchaeum sp.]